MKKIEQVTGDAVVFDYDVKLTRQEINRYVAQDFGTVGVSNPYSINIHGQPYQLLVKQVSYLGHPHLAFKKRIQIPKEWAAALQQENTLLVGLYRYQTTVIYVFFDTAIYKTRSPNNSSAHVHTIDLQKAQEYGVFSKTDINGNVITAVAQSHVHAYLQQLGQSNKPYNAELRLFDDFKHGLQKEWCGIACYQEMITANYNHKFQPEWAGFYLEFKFDNFLNADESRKAICHKVQRKKIGEIDLDLHFHPGQARQFLGDLKAHSAGTNILGNDARAIDKALSLYQKIWYVVVTHETQKDSAHEFITTRFWNAAQGKKDDLSYSKRMKFGVSLNHLKILEINANNRMYLGDFKQGKNNNGKARPPKISIPHKSLNNFLIYQSTF